MKLAESLETLNLCEGETDRMNCPSCGGRNTFTVTKKLGSLIWNCYKAGCNCSGKKNVNMSASEIRHRLRSRSNKNIFVPEFTMPEHVVQLESPLLNAYRDKYNLKCDLYLDVKENRAVFPVLELYTGKLLGAVGRALIPQSYMKWKRYDKAKDIMYITNENKDLGVLVEDCVSAESCENAGFTGIALLGTTLHETRIKDLVKYKEIVIALDKDANLKSLKIKKMLAPYVNCRVVLLPNDLKYFPPAIVQDIILS